ncbi:hypothetical protein BDZ45DRAFT_740937 [Acephala macrosclerotiorum]|nr:hypothetical protein BDZ45DRAFT_740937 [Acephala macrosclerotiorum]
MSGLECLWEDSRYQNHQDAVDIVAVHGPGGHRTHTWTDPVTRTLWLRDFIPKRIQTARVLSFGYTLRGFFGHNTRTHIRGSVNSTSHHLGEDATNRTTYHGSGKSKFAADSAFARKEISNTANTLVIQLYADRYNKCQQRPIVFICHGLGGTIVKEALAQSEGNKDIRTGNSILISAHAILFFSTPFENIDASTWAALKTASFLDSSASDAIPNANKYCSEKEETLESEATKVSEIIADAVSRFINLPPLNRPRLFFLWEDVETDFGSLERIVVPQDTAAPVQIIAERCGIDGTYNTMVKFGSEDRCNVVLSFLERCCAEAPTEVRGRWKVAHTNDQNYRRQEASERLRTTIEPLRASVSLPDRGEKVTAPNMFRPPGKERTWRFVGRSDEYNAMRAALIAPKTDKNVSYQRRYCAIFTIMAKSRESASDSFASIGRIAGLSTAATEEQGKEWLATQTRPWLLIIDNADDPSMDLDQLFPSGNNGHIIITTRNSTFRKYATVGDLNLAGLNEDAALQLLLDRAKRLPPWDDSTMELGKEIVRCMGCLALGMVQAGTTIHMKKWPLKKYLKHWEDYRVKRREKTATKEEEDSIFASFDVSFEHLETTDREDCRDAIDLLKIISFYHFDHIPIQIFYRALRNRQDAESEIDDLTLFAKETVKRLQPPPALPPFIRQDGQTKTEFRIDAAIKTLCSISFTSLSPSGAELSIHPLLRDWVHDGLKLVFKRLWATLAINVLTESILLPPGNAGESHGEFRKQILPHLHTCLRDPIFQDKPIIMPYYGGWWGKIKLFTVTFRPTAVYTIREKGILVAKCGYLYASCGQFKESLGYFSKVTDLLIQVQGDKNPRTMSAMLALAGILWGLGEKPNLDEAIALQQRVVEARKNVLGIDHPDTLRAMTHLGKSYWLRGYHHEALELQQDTANRMRQHKDLGEQHPDTLEALDLYGVTLGSFLRFQESLDIHQIVLKARSKKFPIYRRNTKALKNQMQSAQPPTSSSAPKQDFTDQNLDLLLSLLSTKQNMAMAQLDCWLTLTHQSDTTLLNAAYQNVLEVLQQRRQLLGEEHPWTLWAVCSYCKVIIELGKLEEAKLLLDKGIPAAERGLGKEHPGVLMGRGELSKVYSRQGALAEGKTRQDLYEQAERVATETIAQLRKASGEEHPDTVFATWKLSKLYARQQKWSEAVEACVEALRKGDVKLKMTYPLCAKIENDLQDLRRMLPPGSPHALPSGETDIKPTQAFRSPLKLFSRRSFHQGNTGTW